MHKETKEVTRQEPYRYRFVCVFYNHQSASTAITGHARQLAGWIRIPPLKSHRMHRCRPRIWASGFPAASRILPVTIYISRRIHFTPECARGTGLIAHVRV